MDKINTAFLLSAGRGERLRPLTDTVPKPLLPIGNTTLIENNIALLKKYGIQNIAINVWHLGKMIEAKLGNGDKYGVRIKYSYESELMGTGGGIKKAQNLIESDSFVLLNADIIMNINILNLVNSMNKESIASIAVRKMNAGEKHTPVEVENGYFIGIGRGEYNYTGCAVLKSNLLDYLPENKPACLVREALIPAIRSGRKINAYIHEGLWDDAGTKESYERILKEFK